MGRITTKTLAIIQNMRYNTLWGCCTMAQIEPQKLYTLSQAAALVGIPAVTMRWHARHGQIPARKIGAKVWYVTGLDLLKMLGQQPSTTAKEGTT